MVKWELLIGLLTIAVSIFFGLFSIFFGLNGLSKRIATKNDILAIFYAFSKSSAEKRTVSIEDLKESYNFANTFLSSKGG